MPRTPYSLPEPFSYEEQLEMASTKDLAAHVIGLERVLVDRDNEIHNLSQDVKILKDDRGKAQEYPDPTSSPEYRHVVKLLEDEQRRCNALELDNKTLRSQLAHGDSGATALDQEDMNQIRAFLRLLEDASTTYYPKAVSRSFATAIRRALNITEEG